MRINLTDLNVHDEMALDEAIFLIGLEYKHMQDMNQKSEGFLRKTEMTVLGWFLERLDLARKAYYSRFSPEELEAHKIAKTLLQSKNGFSITRSTRNK